jgi:hypothetical protein
MDIQPRGFFLAIALHHAVKLPAVTLIKRGVVSNKVKGAPHPCRWLLTLRRIPARGSVLHVAFGRVSPGTNRGITVSFACCRHGKRQKEHQGHFTF